VQLRLRPVGLPFGFNRRTGRLFVCSLALSVIVSLSESDARTSGVRFCPIEALTGLSETLLTLLSGLIIPAVAAACHRGMQ
jgi:hypothetical protein